MFFVADHMGRRWHTTVGTWRWAVLKRQHVQLSSVAHWRDEDVCLFTLERRRWRLIYETHVPCVGVSVNLLFVFDSGASVYFFVFSTQPAHGVGPSAHGVGPRRVTMKETKNLRYRRRQSAHRLATTSLRLVPNNFSHPAQRYNTVWPREPAPRATASCASKYVA